MTAGNGVVVESIGTRSGRYYTMKRLMDVVLAGLLGLLCLPLIALVAIAVRLDSPGPAFFTQTRIGSRRVVGPNGPYWETFPFRLVKFRTMVHDADPATHRGYISGYIKGDRQAMAKSGALTSAGSYKLVKDRRITRVGRLLRASSIDELGQLWNVIRGDMTLVGPRPPIDYEVEMYEDRHLLRFATPQGLTGWWQVRGRATTGFEEMISEDVAYIRRQGLGFDLWILVRTVPAVLRRRGAG